MAPRPRDHPMNWIKSIFGTVHDSTKGIINEQELFKAIIGSFGVSSLTGLALVVLTGISQHARDICPDPKDATALTMVAYLIGDLLRRRGDGQVAVELPPGSTVPPTGAIAPPPVDIPTVPPQAIPVTHPPDPSGPGRFIRPPHPPSGD